MSLVNSSAGQQQASAKPDKGNRCADSDGDSMQRFIPPPPAYALQRKASLTTLQLPAPPPSGSAVSSVTIAACSPGSRCSPTTVSSADEERNEQPPSPLALTQQALTVSTTPSGAVVLPPGRAASMGGACFLCMKARTPCFGGVPCERCRLLGVPHMCITTESIYSRALARRGLPVPQLTSSQDVAQEVAPVKVEGQSQAEEQNKNAVVKVVALRTASQVDPIYVMRELAAMKEEQKKLLDDMQQLRIQNEKLEKSLEKAKMEVNNSKLLSLEAQQKLQQQQQKYRQIKDQQGEEDSLSSRDDVQDGEELQEGNQAYDDGRETPVTSFGRGGRGSSRRGITRSRPSYQAQIQEQSGKSESLPESKRLRGGAGLAPQIVNVPLIPHQHLQRSGRGKQPTGDGVAIIVYDLFEKPPKVSNVTPAMGNLLGVDPTEIVGMPWFELVHNNMESQTMAAMTKAIQTGSPAQIQELYRHSNGGFVHTTDTHTVVLDTSGAPHYDSVNVVLMPQQHKQLRRPSSGIRRSAQKLPETVNPIQNQCAVPPVPSQTEVQPLTNALQSFRTPTYLEPGQANRGDEQTEGGPGPQPAFGESGPEAPAIEVAAAPTFDREISVAPESVIETTEDPQQPQQPQPLPSLAAATETTPSDSNSLFFDDGFDPSGTADSVGNTSSSSAFYGYPYN